MITKYSTAAAEYDSLFKEATDRLNSLGVRQKNEDGSVGDLYDYEAGVRVDTLEEYFSNLRNLVYGPSDNELSSSNEEELAKIQEGYKFLKLPVDEPHFKINADTREILVPEDFKKNGVSVLGDEVSEILFFEIDRFYDSMDLSQVNIAFFWSHSSDPNHTVYQTPAFFSVVESDEKTGDDKLIFGWPISSDITKEAGKVSFSVRFYTEKETSNPNDYSLIYSFSTLTQTISISQGLIYDIKGIDVDNKLDIILSDRRLINSPLGKKDPPTMPILIFAKNKMGIEPDAVYYEDFAIEEQVEEDITLAVLGYKADSGSLTYGWFYGDGSNPATPLNNGNFTAPLLNNGFIKVEQFISDNNNEAKIVTYYYKNTVNDYVALSPIKDDKAFSEALEEYGALYVNCSTYTLTKDNVRPGQYFARPRNTLYGVSKINEGEPPYIWVVSGPTEPSITSVSWGDQETLEWTEGLILSIDGKNLENSIFQWKADLTQTVKVENEEALQFTDYFIGKNLNVTEEGYYKINITNSKNGASKSAHSDYILVLKPISDFTVKIINEDGKLIASLSRDLQPFETIVYDWYNLGNLEAPNTSEFIIPEGAVATDYRVKYILTKGDFIEEGVVNFNN